MPTISSIVPLLSHYGYFLLLPIAIVEGPIITIIAAFLASTGVFNVYIVYGIALLGDLIGDGTWYWIARSGSTRALTFITKHCARLGITEEKIAYAEDRLKKNLFRTILLGKITGLVMLPIIIASGLLKISYRKFVACAFSIDIVKDLCFTLLGFYFGRYYISINHSIDRFFLVSSALIALLIGGYYMSRRVHVLIQDWHPHEKI